jgi:hypothetical protein
MVWNFFDQNFIFSIWWLTLVDGQPLNVCTFALVSSKYRANGVLTSFFLPQKYSYGNFLHKLNLFIIQSRFRRDFRRTPTLRRLSSRRVIFFCKLSENLQWFPVNLRSILCFLDIFSQCSRFKGVRDSLILALDWPLVILFSAHWVDTESTESIGNKTLCQMVNWVSRVYTRFLWWF